MRLSVLDKKDDSHTDSVWSTAWASGENADLFLTGSVDESVKSWKGVDNKVTWDHTWTGHTLGVICLAVHPGGEWAASSALDSHIKVWNLNDRGLRADIDTPPSETWAIDFCPTSQSLLVAAAGGSSNQIHVYDALAEGPEDGAWTATSSFVLPTSTTDDKVKKEKFVLCVAYSPDGKRLACGTMDGSVFIFDVAANKLLGNVEGHYKPVRSLTFTPDSKSLLTACDDMHSHLYDVENLALVEAFSGHESWVLSVACHPDGSCFATGSSDSKVKLWDLGTRTCAQTLAEHTDQVWTVDFRSDGSQLTSVSDDKSVVLYGLS